MSDIVNQLVRIKVNIPPDESIYKTNVPKGAIGVILEVEGDELLVNFHGYGLTWVHYSFDNPKWRWVQVINNVPDRYHNGLFEDES